MGISSRPQRAAKRAAIVLLASLLAALGVASPALAQGLGIQPVTVELAAGRMTDTLTVVNQTDTATSFQVRAFTWTEKNGEDVLTPTDQIVLSPPLGTIAAGGQQLIRLVLRKPAASQEETYRIWLDQIPTTVQPGTVRIALRVSIPVFALPANRVTAELSWQLQRDGGKTWLVAVNRGTRHEVIRNMRLTAADGTQLAIDGQVSPYVLGGATRRWPVTVPAGKSVTQVHLTADTHDGRIDKTIAPAGNP